MEDVKKVYLYDIPATKCWERGQLGHFCVNAMHVGTNQDAVNKSATFSWISECTEKKTIVQKQ